MLEIKYSFFLKNSAFVLISIFIIIIIICFFREPILTNIGKFLVVNDTLEPADIIFVLIGGLETRPFYSADLYKQGYAPKIVIPQSELPPTAQFGIYSNQSHAYIVVLHEFGIPDSVIKIADYPHGVSSTRDEAKALNEYIHQKAIKSVIIVTDAFHTRRARYIFRKEIQRESIKIMISPAPHWKFDETNWWKFEEGLIACTNEYLKFIYYLLF